MAKQASKMGDSVNKGTNPQTSIKVDKKYDSKGNLIKYDSTYSYYYSNIKDNKNLEDSIFAISRINLTISISFQPILISMISSFRIHY